MKTESVKLPVRAKNGTVYDAADEMVCQCGHDKTGKGYQDQAHAIARALNTQPQLLEACKMFMRYAHETTMKAGEMHFDDVKSAMKSAIAAAEKEGV